VAKGKKKKSVAKKKAVACGYCGEVLPRITQEVLKHFREIHGKKLTVFSELCIVEPKKQDTPGNKRTENWVRPYQEIQGGLPSLGKKR
jgi:hypothetical protein